MSIRAIYFDIGGVIVRTEQREARQALAAELGMSAAALEELVFGGQMGRQAQSGLVAEAELWAYACRQAGWAPGRASEFRQRFFGGDRLDADLLAYIQSLRPAYRTGIISNAMTGTRQMVEGAWQMGHLFDALVLSGEVGCMKPDARIYRHALALLSMLPDQAVFIDDFQVNVDGARAVGMHAIRFQSLPQMRLELERIMEGK